MVDNRAKYYALYRDALSEQQVEVLPQERYWDLKRHRVPDEQICQITAGAASRPVDAAVYLRYRDRWIENDRYTDLDELVPGIETAIARWQEAEHEVRIATMRKRGEVLRREIARLGVDRWCAHVLSEDDNGGEWVTKAGLLRGDLDGYEGQAVLIGDTEGDIFAAREAGIGAVVVTNGIRCAAMLRLHVPGQVLATSAAFDPGGWPGLSVGPRGAGG